MLNVMNADVVLDVGHLAGNAAVQLTLKQLDSGCAPLATFLGAHHWEALFWISLLFFSMTRRLLHAAGLLELDGFPSQLPGTRRASYIDPVAAVAIVGIIAAYPFGKQALTGGGSSWSARLGMFAAEQASTGPHHLLSGMLQLAGSWLTEVVGLCLSVFALLLIITWAPSWYFSSSLRRLVIIAAMRLVTKLFGLAAAIIYPEVQVRQQVFLTVLEACVAIGSCLWLSRTSRWQYPISPHTVMLQTALGATVSLLFAYILDKPWQVLKAKAPKRMCKAALGPQQSQAAPLSPPQAAANTTSVSAWGLPLHYLPSKPEHTQSPAAVVSKQLLAALHDKPKYVSKYRPVVTVIKVHGNDPEDLPQDALVSLNRHLIAGCGMRVVSAAVRRGCVEFVMELVHDHSSRQHGEDASSLHQHIAQLTASSLCEALPQVSGSGGGGSSSKSSSSNSQPWTAPVEVQVGNSLFTVCMAESCTAVPAGKAAAVQLQVHTRVAVLDAHFIALNLSLDASSFHGQKDMQLLARMGGCYYPVTIPEAKPSSAASSAAMQQIVVQGLQPFHATGRPCMGSVLTIDCRKGSAIVQSEHVLLLHPKHASMVAELSAALAAPPDSLEQAQANQVLLDLGRWFEFINSLQQLRAAAPAGDAARTTAVTAAGSTVAGPSASGAVVDPCDVSKQLPLLFQPDNVQSKYREMGCGLLCHAVRNGWVQAAECLVNSMMGSAGMSWGHIYDLCAAMSPENLSLLHLAVLSGSLAMVRVAARWAAADSSSWLAAAGPCDATPLHLAAVLPGGADLAAAILEACPDTEQLWHHAPTSTGLSAAQLAAVAKRQQQQQQQQQWLMSRASAAITKLQQQTHAAVSCVEREYCKMLPYVVPLFVGFDAEDEQQYQQGVAKAWISAARMWLVWSQCVAGSMVIRSLYEWDFRQIAFPLMWGLPYCIVGHTFWFNHQQYIANHEAHWVGALFGKTFAHFCLGTLGFLSASTTIASSNRLYIDVLVDGIMAAMCEQVSTRKILIPALMDAVATASIFKKIQLCPTWKAALGRSMLRFLAQVGLSVMCELRTRTHFLAHKAQAGAHKDKGKLVKKVQ